MATTTRAEPVGKQRILEAAAALFVEQGYAETSLRDIASSIDMKAGSLYYHFASKDDLFIELLQRGIAMMIDGFDAPDLEAGATAAEQLEAHVAAHLRVLHGNHPITTLHVTTFRTAPETVREAVVPERDAYEAKWTALLSEILPDRSVEEIGMLRLVLFGAMNSSIDWFDADRGNFDAFAQLVTDQFWSGAAAQAAPAPSDQAAPVPSERKKT